MSETDISTSETRVPTCSPVLLAVGALTALLSDPSVGAATYGSLRDMPSASRPPIIIGERDAAAAQRRARVKALKGKYAFVKTSSVEFLRRKHDELASEN